MSIFNCSQKLSGQFFGHTMKEQMQEYAIIHTYNTPVLKPE